MKELLIRLTALKEIISQIDFKKTKWLSNSLLTRYFSMCVCVIFVIVYQLFGLEGGMWNGWLTCIFTFFSTVFQSSGRWANDNKRLCTKKKTFTVEKISPRAGLELRTARSVDQIVYAPDHFLSFYFS